jgi:hypothetical protein
MIHDDSISFPPSLDIEGDARSHLGRRASMAALDLRKGNP